MTTATTTTTTIEKEMLALETQFWQAMKDNDVAAAARATADPCIVAGASGVASINKKMFAEMMGSGWHLNSFKIDKELLVQSITDDIRIVAYKVHEELTVDDKPVGIDAAEASVWVRKGGKWECALHTESLLGDAYGRDRKPVM